MTFLLREPIVFPQKPKLFPSNLVMLQKTKESERESVFPLLTAPSQIMAVLSLKGLFSHHQVRVRCCFSENSLKRFFLIVKAITAFPLVESLKKG